MEWNLDALYTSFESEKLEQDVRELEAYVPRITEWAKTLTPTEEGVEEALTTYITYQEAIRVLASKLGAFASLSFSTNTKNSQALKLDDRVQKISSDFTLPFTLFEKYIKDLPKQAMDKAIDGSEFLQTYRFHLEEIRQHTDHMLTEREEVLLSKMKQTGSAAWTTLQSKVTSEMTVTVNVKGEEQTLPLQSARNLAFNADPEVRKAAYYAELKAYEAYDSVSAAALNAIKGEVITEAELRGFASPLEKTLMDSRMSEATLNAMLEAMRERLDQFRNYLKKKAEYLGHSNGLPFYDVFAPMNANEKEITVDEAKQEVLDNFYGFSQELGDFAKKAFDNEWLDIYPKEGKRGGAFCSNLAAIKESRFLLNFTGYQKNVITMAHELGHGFHGEQIFNEALLNNRYPMPLAETASIFCETIMKKALLKKAQPEEALGILESSIQGYNQVITDIYSRYLFETALFEKREEASLSAEELKEMMLTAQQEAYGDGLDPEFLHPYMWMNKTHYYSAGRNFYNFPYAFGLLFAKGLYSKYQEMGDAFLDKYNMLLRETGKNTIEGVAAQMGIDVTDKAFWLSSLDQINEEIEQFIAIVDGL